ncbi:hypothetical protein [Paenibacillus polymyxa]|nr:hypothetical protein [Paenibacillus polymyxa]MDY8023811.1 hypothetical protein [Paenibacillus polymyxa]
MNHPIKECIQKLGLTHRASVVLYDISWEGFVVACTVTPIPSPAPS